MSEYLARLTARRELLWQLTLRNIKGQRKQSILGAFWVVIQPLGLLAATVFLRAVLLGGGRGYSLEAMAALVPWTLFSAAFAGGVSSVADNAGLVRKIAFPRVVLPLSVVFSSLVNFFAAFVIFALLCVLRGHLPPIAALWVPAILAIELVFVVGVVLGLASLNVFLRDIRHTVPFLTMLLYIATPIIYETERLRSLVTRLLGESQVWLVNLNPLVPIVESFKAAVLGGHMDLKTGEWVSAAVDPATLAWAAGTALVTLALGYAVFRKTEPVFADVI